jgi:hypothetical protein
VKRTTKLSAAKRGENSPQAKLRIDHVKEIRRLRVQGALLRELAEQFNVSIPAIGLITSNRNWKHIT